MKWIIALYSLQRVAIVVWVLLIAGVIGRVAFSKPGSQSVVPIYRIASERWLRGDDLYADQRPLDLYRNPPGFAAAFVPFSMLPPKLVEISWRLLSASVFLFALGRWTRFGLPRQLTPGETAAVFLLVAPLALASLNNGQTNLIVAGFLLFGAADAAQGRWHAAGLWFAAAAGVKMYPLAIALLVGLISPRRFLPWLVLGCVGFAIVPFVCQRPEYVLDQYRSMKDSTGADDRALAELERAPRDLFLVLRVWFEAPPVEAYSAFKLLVAGGMAVLVWWQARRSAIRTAVLSALNLGCLWITVLGPATETHTYTLLAPTAAIVMVFAYAEKSIIRRVVAIVGYTLLISPVVRDMFPNGVAWQILAPQPIGAMLLLFVVMWDAWRAGKKESGEKNVARAEPGVDMIEVCPTEPRRSAA
jgi:hypothetical protein